MLTRKNSILDLIFNEFDHIENEVNFNPANDISESENNYEVNISLAGFKKKNINLKVENNKLFVNGEREANEKKYNLKQSSFGKFKKVYHLPDFSDVDNISAKMEDGMLQIDIPKNKEKLERKLIEIN